MFFQSDFDVRNKVYKSQSGDIKCNEISWNVIRLAYIMTKLNGPDIAWSQETLKVSESVNIFAI